MRLALAPKLTLIFVAFAILVLTAFGVPAYYLGREALLEATTADLLSIAIEKQSALDTWIAERVRDIVHLAGTAQIVDGLDELTGATVPGPRGDAARAEISRILGPHVGANGAFEKLRLIEPRAGRIVVSTDALEVDSFREDRPYFTQGRTGVFVQNPYYSLAHAEPVMAIAAPLLDGEGRLVGVIAGQPRLAEVNAIIARRSGQRDTDDAYLVNTSNLFVTQPRLIGDAAVLSRGNYTPLVEECLSGASGGTVALDYRDRRVVAVYRWLPERKMCLVATIDEDEALHVTRDFGRSIVAGALVVLLGALIVATLLARRLLRPVKELEVGAAAVAGGDFTLRLRQRSGDELGRLSRSFNAMTAALAEKDAQVRGYAAELESRVAERTAELRAAQQELLKKERLAVLGQLTATVSHELRNPLGTLNASLYVIRRQTKLENDAVRRAFERADRSIERCDQIIEELLDYSRDHRLDLAPTPVDQWLREVVEEQNLPGGIRLEFALQCPDLSVDMDGERMRRAVINVFDNACHAISAAHDASSGKGRGGLIEVISARHDGRIELGLKDNGSGVEASLLGRIFEPLFSTKSVGVGLGLPLVRQIMEQHRGGVELDSRVGEGTSVTLWLPLDSGA